MAVRGGAPINQCRPQPDMPAPRSRYRPSAAPVAPLLAEEDRERKAIAALQSATLQADLAGPKSTIIECVPEYVNVAAKNSEKKNVQAAKKSYAIARKMSAEEKMEPVPI